jgi:RecJ-like exonuclease
MSMTSMETCRNCQGAGGHGNYETGEICNVCNGSGEVEELTDEFISSTLAKVNSRISKLLLIIDIMQKNQDVIAGRLLAAEQQVIKLTTTVNKKNKSLS